jgi:ABC-type Mn2+/Zn2+ transport system permease subunit
MSGLFAEPFMAYALAGGVLISVLCAFLGVFLVLRRMVFVAMALSELAACGVALGLWLAVAPALCAALLCLLGVGILLMPGREAVVSRESIVGAVYAVSAAFALILMALNPLARAHGLDLFAGDLLYTQTEHLIVLGGLVLMVGTLAVLFYRRVLFSFFDAEMALSLGVPARTIELGFLIVVALAIAFSMRVAGVVFVFASLVVLPVFGLLVGRRVAPALALACGGAVVTTAAGLAVSFRLDLPAAPAIVAAQGMLALLAAGARRLLR